ncbi:membrane protein insertase YidC [Secundilactobacillus malefermentans]|uniref:Membrane protein insertase YidC n=1 Tax=Secundilactobacillus malefermentans TaxID=176292 RepID=A0A4R5NQY8_9LACO|nr:membrane protein insertase YidC [Secundilactobacillus malefermentans]KRM57140.1 preprotein translocase subunit YidC [Secundilactobacillus malefermentans DSM 5705 = KCTC 3548]QEA30709.1 membrane protein insertase YidC [Secundilactobacillus malefermentans]TDG79197.1 hypothetical protein C5L31_001146 [Secundilactobacillus malefermentans]
MKKFKRASLFTLLAGLAIFLSGCVRTTKSGKPYGFIYDYLAKPGQNVMDWLANFFGGSYGWAVVALTVLVRMVLLPLMISQLRKSTIQQEKMSMIRPQMTEIQKRQKAAKTPEEQSAAGQQMMALYRDNGISITGGIGCLPLLIQMPVFAGLYAAIRYSPELSSSVFMGIPLGHSSLILAILAGLSYLGQGYLSLLGMPEDQKKQMRMTLIISPAMILFISISAPAGLGLYFFIGGIFACIQTIIINMYRPRIRKQIEAEVAKRPVKPVTVTETPVSESTDSPEKPKETTIEHHNNRNRNAGKQHHHRD